MLGVIWSRGLDLRGLYGLNTPARHMWAFPSPFRGLLPLVWWSGFFGAFVDSVAALCAPRSLVCNLYVLQPRD